MANCNGNCGSCSGCAKELVLTEQELELIDMLAQFSFLPVARKAADMTPIYLEDTRYSREQYSLILQCLEKKSLISIDYDKPLAGADMSAYKGYPVHGSFCLTERGQQVLQMLELQGITEI